MSRGFFVFLAIVLGSLFYLFFGFNLFTWFLELLHWVCLFVWDGSY